MPMFGGGLIAPFTSGLAQQLPTDPRIGQAMRGGMFANGGQLSKKQILLGGLMDAIGSFAGKQPSFIPQVMQQQQQDRQDEREDERWQQRFDQERNKPQVVNRGKNGVAVVNPATMEVNDLIPPTEDEPKPTTLQQNADYLRTLNPNLTDEQLFEIVQRALPGYGNSDEVYDQRRQLKATPPGKAPSMGGGGGGGGPSITPTARAKYIAEAEEAISRGAPRDAVYARLQKMGVQ